MRITSKRIFSVLVFLFIGYCVVLLVSSSSSRRKLIPPLEGNVVDQTKIPFVNSQRVLPTKPLIKPQTPPIETKVRHSTNVARNTFRDPLDRPRKIGLELRPMVSSRQEEDIALQQMWQKLDSQTRDMNQGFDNYNAGLTREQKEKQWKKSLEEFEDRMKELANYNETMREFVANTRQSLLDEIFASQNPPDCEKANYLFVENDKNDFGFGAQLHHFIYTTIVGYASNRVVIIEKGNFKYAVAMEEWCGKGHTSIECFFQPLGNCTQHISDMEGKRAPLWIPGDENNQEEKILRLRCRSSVEYRNWIPSKLQTIVQTFHQRPHLFFVGHFTYYFMRPSDAVKKGYEEMKNAVGFRNPIMGMHVRGKEKKVEAPVHDLVEYMPYVRYPVIYLATDDSQPVEDSKKYTNHTWLMVKDLSSGRLSGVGDRHGRNAILNLIYDMYFLSECDLFIGTDSSQISRAVYELMQVRHDDAFRLGVSLDTIQKDRKFDFYWFLI